MYTKGRTLLG